MSEGEKGSDENPAENEQERSKRRPPQQEEPEDPIVQDMLADLQSQCEGFYAKVQFKKQKGRNDLGILSTSPLTAKTTWSQKCQIVIKDMPAWLAMLVLKRILSELNMGYLAIDGIKARQAAFLQAYGAGDLVLELLKPPEPEKPMAIPEL